MNVPSSPQNEIRAVRRGALRAGCVVRELAVQRTSLGPRAVGRVECPDGWAAARMLVEESAEDARTPEAHAIASELRTQAPDDESFARAVQTFVKSRVRFEREKGEIFQGIAHTLSVGFGDCDDHARLAYAIAVAGGLPTVMAFLHHGGAGAQPSHAVAQLCPNGRAYWAETTIDADFGEHPLTAAARLGLVNARDDLAREVVVMSEQDLPPAPPGYAAANPPAKVEQDTRALTMLGFDVGQTKATDPDFRAAVAAFQRSASGLTIDGLIGPNTRARLARELGSRFPGDAFAMGYLGAAAPHAARIAWGREIFDRAFAEMGIPASAEGKEALMALSWGETRFGDPALGWAESHNWGAITFNAARGEPFVTWGFLEHGDRDASGKPVTRRFQAYPSDLEGAKDKIRIALRSTAAKAAVQKETGVPEALAEAMFDAHYYEGTPNDTDGDGVPGTRKDRILAYAKMIRGSMATFAQAGGGPATPSTPSSSGSSVAGVVAFLIGAGVAAAAGWWVASS